MKKVFSLTLTFAIFSFLAQNIFAKTDIQITAGYQLDTFKKPAVPSYKEPEIMQGFYFGATNYNLFDVLPIKNILSLGFMEEISFSYYPKTKKHAEDLAFSYFIGPAAGITFQNILKLQVSLGIYFGTYAILNDMNLGLGLDAQIKFLPQNKISPVVGYRYKVNIFNANKVGNLNSHDIYLALSINLKEKEKKDAQYR